MLNPKILTFLKYLPIYTSTKLYSSSPLEDYSSMKFLRSSKSSRIEGSLPPAFYGGRHIVSMLPGHGIGPELMETVKDIFMFVHAPVDFEVLSITDTQNDVRNAIMSIKRNRCCIKGNIDTISGEEASLYNSPNVAIRKKLDLYASLNVLKSYSNIRCKYNDINVVIIRQNTEGEYAMMEHETKSGIVESMKICTAFNTKRIAHWAFKFCKQHDRKKLTIVHKANIMKLSDGLFMNTIKEVSKKYPDIKVNDIIIDNCCMQLVSDPHQFDVLVTPNLYGSILTNVICGLIGGAGIMSASNYGDTCAIFECATRNTGTELAGKDKANPVAMLNASVDLLVHLGHTKAADYIEQAINMTLDDKIATVDIGGTSSTTDFINHVKLNIVKLMNEAMQKEVDDN